MYIGSISTGYYGGLNIPYSGYPNGNQAVAGVSRVTPVQGVGPSRQFRAFGTPQGAASTSGQEPQTGVSGAAQANGRPSPTGVSGTPQTGGQTTPAGVFGAAQASGQASPSGVTGAAQTGRAQDPDTEKKIGRKSSPAECQTCKERKYQDGSDENVSFKSAAHIAPGAAGAVVRAHEGEHVSNAYTKAAQGGGQVVNASVSIHTAVCPECGRTYVSGGTTHTTIKYPNESNPYQKNLKSLDAIRFRGMNIDYAA